MGLSIFDMFMKGGYLKLGYGYYVERCKQEKVTPVSFRVWAKADAEYDIEWEAAKQDYDDEVDQQIS